jgi:hypothetical protein
MASVVAVVSFTSITFLARHNAIGLVIGRDL